MKSRDIFRPLHLPSVSTPTSIFRRSHHQQQQPSSSGHDDRQQTRQASGESETYVVSSVVPPAAQWPPGLPTNTLSSSDGGERDRGGSRHRRLDRSSPLSSGPTSSGEQQQDGSPASLSGSPSRRFRDRLSRSMRSMSPSKHRATAANRARDAAAAAAATTTITPPSYYRIELVDPSDAASAGEGPCAKLLAGDDSSVQLTPDHNERIQLASASSALENVTVIGGGGATPIIRASPIVERSESCAEQRPGEDDTRADAVAGPRQRWTINEDGNIIAVPPSPSGVAMVHPHTHHVHASAREVEPEKKPAGGGPKSCDAGCYGLPMLVKASSSGASCSSSDDSFVPSQPRVDDDEMDDIPLSTGSDELESPPRMNRSALSPPHSLFADSVSSGSSSGGRNRRSPEEKVSGSSRSSRSNKSKGGESSCSDGSGTGGCGTRLGLMDLLSSVLDVFSLNGGCCHQRDGGGGVVGCRV